MQNNLASFVVRHLLTLIIMKVRFRNLICFVAALFFLLACSDSDEKVEIPPKSADRTVLVYMAASNSLRSFSRDDIEEIEEGFLSLADHSTCNFLLYLEQGKETNPINNAYERVQPSLMRLTLNKGKLTWVEVKKYPAQLSTDYKVMGEVFRDAFTLFPAEKKGLILWSHADGWIPSKGYKPETRWFGEDKLNGVSHYTEILDLKKALDKAPFLDFILFDACLMQSVEVAYEFRQNTHYMLGSPMEIPGPGAPYQEVVPVLYSKKKDIAQDIADAYYGFYEQTYSGHSHGNDPWYGGVSMTVLDLTKVEHFFQETKSLLHNNELDYLSLDSKDVFYYDFREISEIYYRDVLGLMKKNFNSNLTSAWLSSYNGLIPYYKTTKTNYSGVIGQDVSMQGSHGVSMYVPVKSKKYDIVNEYYSQMSWYRDMIKE